MGVHIKVGGNQLFHPTASLSDVSGPGLKDHLLTLTVQKKDVLKILFLLKLTKWKDNIMA